MNIDNPNDSDIAELFRRVRDLETQSPVGFTSVTRGALRIASNEGLLVQGTARTSGTQYIDGRLEGAGTFDWTGPMWLRGSIMLPGNLTGVGTLLWSGPWELRGNGSITGSAAITGTLNVAGATTLNNDLTLGTGRIVVGPMVFDRGGAYGGRITAPTLVLDSGSVLGSGTIGATGGLVAFAGGVTATTGDIVAASGDIKAVLGDVGGFSKSFWIDHPTKPGKWLRHGAIEGPTHDVFYRGAVEFDGSGEAVYLLPDYYDELVLGDDPATVHVTPKGRPFPVGADDVADGRVTVYGEPGRSAHVTVTAARGRFDVEPDKPPFGPQPRGV